VAANWVGQILRRNCLLQHVVNRKIEANLAWRKRRGKWSKHLLDDLKEEIGYWIFKVRAL
jgi:hypothetical protein